MAARYFVRERIFTGSSPELVDSAPVFAVDDLTEDECKTLADSVQQYFEEVHESAGGGPWTFDLAPSAEEDPATFINLKIRWRRHKDEMDQYRQSSGRSWQSEIFWFYSVADEHAEIIRDLRGAQIPTVYLQYDLGHGYATFDCVDSLTWDEIQTLQAVLSHEFYEMGMVLRVVSDWHAEREPEVYVQARRDWQLFEEAVNNDEADESRLVASGISYQFIEEIRALRKKPVIYGPAEDKADPDDKSEFEDASSPDTNGKPHQADESLRSGYRDPDNYWRNVWLYRQRKAGKSNTTILAELTAQANERQWAPLESENALRNAIDAIATFHGWPLLKGKVGRRKSNAHRSNRIHYEG